MDPWQVAQIASGQQGEGHWIHPPPSYSRPAPYQQVPVSAQLSASAPESVSGAEEDTLQRPFSEDGCLFPAVPRSASPAASFVSTDIEFPVPPTPPPTVASRPSTPTPTPASLTSSNHGIIIGVLLLGIMFVWMLVPYEGFAINLRLEVTAVAGVAPPNAER
ncbi:hypothetical protein B0H12DRAFT_1237322 [Mycena haematopus]|nr:hypothetical protein B0H12DRAFT_1237322 [Mycena haematopus]